MSKRVYADARNTPSVRKGYELGGYVKEPDMSGSVKLNMRHPKAEEAPFIHDEGDFRRWVIGRLHDKEPSQVSYIESHQTSAGIPDLNIFMRGKDLWIELKVLSDTKTPKMRPTQKRWHADRWHNGGFSWVLCCDLDYQVLLVLPGHVAAGMGTKQGVWRAAAATHPLLDVVDVLRSLTKRF